MPDRIFIGFDPAHVRRPDRPEPLTAAQVQMQASPVVGRPIVTDLNHHTQPIAYFDDWLRANTPVPDPTTNRIADANDLDRTIIAMLMDNLGIDHLDIPQCTLEMYRPRFKVEIHLDGQLEEVHVKLEENALPA